MQRLWLLLILLAINVGCQSVCCPEESYPTTTLFSRATFKDYEKCTFSFEHGIRDDADNKVTRNDWDLEYGNGGDYFHVNMVRDDRSMIWNLGLHRWDDIGSLKLPFSEEYKEKKVKVGAHAGHIYLVHTRDSDTDLRALFRVDRMEKGELVEISWKLLTHEKVQSK